MKTIQISVGETLVVDRLDAAVGAKVTFPAVLLVDGADVTADPKALASVKVTGEVLAEQKGPTRVSKETYYSVKRDLLKCQKRPTIASKETCYSVTRHLLECEKRPTKVSKETYYSVKRDLL